MQDFYHQHYGPRPVCGPAPAARQEALESYEYKEASWLLRASQVAELPPLLTTSISPKWASIEGGSWEPMRGSGYFRGLNSYPYSSPHTSYTSDRPDIGNFVGFHIGSDISVYIHHSDTYIRMCSFSPSVIISVVVASLWPW